MGRRVITAKDVAVGLRAEVAAERRALGKPATIPGGRITARPRGDILAARAMAPQADDYKMRLLKYIPAEIVAGFLAIDGIIKSTTEVSVVVSWIVFFVLLVLTPFYAWRITTEPNKPTAKADIIVSTIAFFVWVFALGGPFSSLGWYLPIYGAILLIVYTLTIPVFVGK